MGIFLGSEGKMNSVIRAKKLARLYWVRAFIIMTVSKSCRFNKDQLSVLTKKQVRKRFEYSRKKAIGMSRWWSLFRLQAASLLIFFRFSEWVSRLQSRAWSFSCIARFLRRTKKKERLLVVSLLVSKSIFSPWSFCSKKNLGSVRNKTIETMIDQILILLLLLLFFFCRKMCLVRTKGQIGSPK